VRSQGDRRLVSGLIRWFSAHRRDLPWRRRRTPYRTWVSEVMLQQTTAEVVARRFDRFVARFPGVGELARAPLRSVLAEWAGLGYYRRARMLHSAARECVARFGGKVPRAFTDLSSLPGVGDYTAGAIASLGFGESEPAVDGNVARVWSRFEAVSGERKELAELVRPWIPPARAAAFNEALIELGATVCAPVEPRCGACPIRAGCLAYQRGEVDRYPPPPRRRASVPITSARGILRDARGRVLVVRRPASASLLAGFDELPGRWLAPGEEPREVLADVFASLGFPRPRVGPEVATAKHVITHHRIRSVAFEVAPGAFPPTRPEASWGPPGAFPPTRPEASWGPPGASRAARAAPARFVAPSHLEGPAVTTETRKLAAGGGARP
jgi:A/G-specific adenine glycosylase